MAPHSGAEFYLRPSRPIRTRTPRPICRGRAGRGRPSSFTVSVQPFQASNNGSLAGALQALVRRGRTVTQPGPAAGVRHVQGHGKQLDELSVYFRQEFLVVFVGSSGSSIFPNM